MKREEVAIETNSIAAPQANQNGYAVSAKRRETASALGVCVGNRTNHAGNAGIYETL